MEAALLAAGLSTVTAQAGVFSAGSPAVLVVLLGALSLLPFALLVGTSFVKISVVFGLLRNALGTQQVPSNTVLTALAAMLSLHVMAPTTRAVVDAAGPAFSRAFAQDSARTDSARALGEAWSAARPPVQRFLRDNATPRDRALFYDLARRAQARGTAPTATPSAAPTTAPSAEPTASAAAAPAPTIAPAPVAPAGVAQVQADDLDVLLPAFIVSELTRAFAIGFLVFLPFLVVDLVIANLLTALGMSTVSPTSVALPFKLLLFILADGWYLLSRALVLSYR